jgi:3,4-dihydroxy 2-butanone 4-phosphate synthase/GTP cyclohydrolase II
VLCEILDEDGSMARGEALTRFAERHGLVIVSVADLVQYRRSYGPHVICVARAALPTRDFDGTISVYESLLDRRELVAVTCGDVSGRERVLVRVHSECLTGDVLGSARCDCGDQLQLAQARLADEGCGVLLYVRGDEGRGIGLADKVRAYSLQDEGYDTVDANVRLGFAADSREYSLAAQVLLDLGVRSVRLLTNNPVKCQQLSRHGVAIVERVPLTPSPTASNLHYLVTKRERMGHILPHLESALTREPVA